ncbi:MAG: CinA family nicotinamide mononucleotide deamidase-related protein [Cyanobacteriota bacterium]
MSLIAEVLCIGTELLLGDIVNTNATYFAQELSSIGIDLLHITTVGDNKKRIVNALDIATKRADIILTTGGLGPTEDDITHECIADYFCLEQRFHKDIAEKIEYIFKKIRVKEMPKSNLKQAYLPNGADILTNNHGTAPGIILHNNGKTVLTFPGVPSELKGMWEDIAKNYLIKMNPEKKVIKSITLRFTGEGESAIAEKVADFLNNSNPTVAPYAGRSEARLRITAKEESKEKALELIEPVKKEILARLGDFFYGYEDDNLQSVVINKIKEKKKKISIAEIFTTGQLINRVLSVDGYEDVVKFSSVFSNRNFMLDLLNLPKDLLIENSLFSEFAISEIARHLNLFSKSDIAIVIFAKMSVDEDSGKKIGKAIISINTEDETITKKIDYPKLKKEDLDYYSSQITLNLLKNLFF